MKPSELREFRAPSPRRVDDDDDQLCDAQHAVSFTSARAKLTIASIDPGLDIAVAAQFNPKELQVVQTITWQEHQGLKPDEANDVLVEFAGMQPETMQVELLFDGMERGGRTDSRGPTVMKKIQDLKLLASPMKPDSKDDDLRRPPYCVVVWGDGTDGLKMPRFRCVIESMTIKYTAWDTTGTVLRATVTLALKAADPVVKARGKKAPPR